MKHASAAEAKAKKAAAAAVAAATAVAEEAKAAEAVEGQPPPVLRLSTSELENELLRRKKAKEAAASEDTASCSSLPDAEPDAAQPMADAEGGGAGRGQKRAAEASGAVQAPLQDSNTWAPTHRARLKAPHADTPFSRVGTGCRRRGGCAAKEDQAERAVGEKAHVIALLRAGVPHGDISLLLSLPSRPCYVMLYFILHEGKPCPQGRNLQFFQCLPGSVVTGRRGVACAPRHGRPTLFSPPQGRGGRCVDGGIDT